MILSLGARILIERYGLDRDPPRPRSLEEVARAHGLSRLETRLLEADALRSFLRMVRQLAATRKSA